MRSLMNQGERRERRLYRSLRWIAAVLLSAIVVAALGGCSRSPVVEYYTLIPVPAAEARLVKTLDLPTIQVVLPTLPALVDRAEFTELAAGNRVTVHENVRWAVGLRKIVRDYFISHLKQAVPTLDILSSANQAAIPNARKLVMVFDRFNIYAGQFVELSLSWRLSGEPSKLFSKSTELNWRNEISVKQDIVGEQTSDAIAAIRSALGKIGDEISQTLLSQGQSGG